MGGELRWKPGGSAHMLEVYGYVPLWRPPFQAPLLLQGPTFLHLVSVLMPSVFCFSINLALLDPFLSDFGKISAPNTLIMTKIRSQDPSFLRKKKNVWQCRPYFWKPVRYIPTKNNLSALPGGRQGLQLFVMFLNN